MTIGRRVQMGRGRRAGYGVSGGGGPTYDTLQEYIDNATAGDTINVTGQIFSSPATVTKSLTIVGGTLTTGANVTALRIAANSVTITGMTITGPQYAAYSASERGIYSSSLSAYTDVAITSCVITHFGNAGIWLNAYTNVAISYNTITGTGYMGVALLGAATGTVSYNRITHVGETTNVAGEDNAYGVALTGTGGSQRCSNIIVEHNTVEDMPGWHAFDTHGGIDCTFRSNTTARISRPFFLTSNSNGTYATNITVSGNTVNGTTGRSDYRDLVAVTLYDTDNCTITGNALSSDYPDLNQYANPGDDRVYDYTTLSSGLTVSGNTLI